MSRKAKTLLNQMIQAGTITKEGEQYLTIATDPFHDEFIEARGFPDLNTVPTLVQTFTQTQSISSASTVPWDAHIFLHPVSPSMDNGTTGPIMFNGTRHFFPQSQTWQCVQPPNETALVGLCAGYNVVRTQSGSPWYDGTNVGTQLALPLLIEGGCYRLVSAGVEVVDTTPDLYKQGSVTYFRIPSHSQTVCPIVTGTQATGMGEFGWPMLMQSYNLPPPTQSNAQLVPTSRTLAAEDGYYGVATLNQNPTFLSGLGLPPFGTMPPSLASIMSANADQIAYGPRQWPLEVRPSTPSSRVLPFDVHGAIFSGLAPQSTLQVTVRYYVERIPGPNDPDLLVLTRPPTPYDPVIQEIYSRILTNLPVGCKVSENPLGEWFNEVLEAVMDYAPAIGAAFGPLGGVLGKGVASGAGQVLKQRRTPQVLTQSTTVMKKTDAADTRKKQKRRRRPAKAKPKKKNP